MRYFTRKEFTCKCGCNFNTVDVELLEVLEDIREYFGVPVTITSACRCVEHNKSIGGKVKSKHLLGIAADIIVKNTSPAYVYDYVNGKYSNKYGIGNYNTFTHIDIRKYKARW